MSPRQDPTRAWKVRINAPLAARVELLLTQNLTYKPKYGSRKELIETLLQEWVQKQTLELEENEELPCQTS